MVTKILHFSTHIDGTLLRIQTSDGTVHEVHEATIDKAVEEMFNKVCAYDSTVATIEHIRKVQTYLNKFAKELMQRGEDHDASKLSEFEKPHFDRETPLLKELVYGSDEYKASLKRLGEALSHHYAVNSHHPEHHKLGINGMTLFDIVEMFCDWKAASERNKGAILNLEASFKRFNFDPQLADIFRNTARDLGWPVTEQ